MRIIVSKYKKMPVQVRASFWFLICSFLQKGISMVTTPIFTRIMSTSDYGQYGVFNSWFGIITIIVSLNMYAGVHSQGIVKFSEEKNEFTSSLQGFTTSLITFWTIIYLLFQDFWNNLFSLTTIQMLSMLLMILLTSVFNFWANLHRVTYSYRMLVIITLLYSLVKPLVEIVLVMHFDDKVTARILGGCVVELILFSWIYVFQLYKGKVFFSKRFWKYALLFNLPLVPHYLSQTVLNSADRIMINDIVGSDQSGIYNLAYSVSLIMTLFNTALSQTISPWIYQKIKSKQEKEIAPIAYITLMIIAGVNLVLILLAPEVVKIFAPNSYYEAIWVIPPVAMSAYFMYSYDLFAKFAFYFEKTVVVMIASVLGAILNIGLNYLFINIYGYIAAGYTTLICYIVYALVHYLFMRKVCREFCDGKFPYETKKIMYITVPFVVLGVVFLFTYNYPMIRYGIVVVFLIILLLLRKKLINVVNTIISVKKAK